MLLKTRLSPLYFSMSHHLCTNYSCFSVLLHDSNDRANDSKYGFTCCATVQTCCRILCYNSCKGAKFLIFCPANAPLLLHAYSADFKFLLSKLVESNENILAKRL